MMRIPKNNVAVCRQKTKPETSLTCSEGSSATDQNESKEPEQIFCSESCWLTSKETMRILKVSSCELMHRRERGELPFKKKGNSYLYNIETNDII